jgi:hypothetical protein
VLDEATEVMDEDEARGRTTIDLACIEGVLPISAIYANGRRTTIKR